MSDQCKHCVVRGDYHRCTKTPCFNHESWISLTYRARITALEEALKEIVNLPSERQDEATNYALNILAQLSPTIERPAIK